MRGSMSPKEKQERGERRRMVLAALRGAEKKALAAENGVSRQRLYDLLEEAAEDPEGRYEDAVAEASFRREVRDIFRERAETEEDG